MLMAINIDAMPAPVPTPTHSARDSNRNLDAAASPARSPCLPTLDAAQPGTHKFQRVKPGLSSCRVAAADRWIRVCTRAG